ncbi:hypothetical protein FAF44_46380 [Nonomuraea sp. MG754425]|nr:hypothetical protein [Nonomuraea sp. MG754425]
MIHLDVKKLGRIPDGGGHRAHGRSQAARGRGYDDLHTAIDDHTRLAYVEILADEKGVTRVAFLTRAAAFFAADQGKHSMIHAGHIPGPATTGRSRRRPAAYPPKRRRGPAGPLSCCYRWWQVHDPNCVG